ncbi:hypothetical protein [Synechococcus sp. M16CYN]|uniref:hypothetical protein n=1 Tax=Synechococcus sp. M16CYN TaxID=3103139 RepID=UPI003245A28F
MNSIFRRIAYVSVCVTAWGVVASLMDWMLLAGGVYTEGTLGQAFTFMIYGATAVVLGIRFSSRFLKDIDSKLDQKISSEE